jgi:hypothetical protein
LGADTVDTTGALWRSAALRLAAFAKTSCSSLDSVVRAFVICALRLWASVTREWICLVVAAGIVVVAAASPVPELEAALLKSAADPPATAPPATIAVIQIDGHLIGSPIPLSSTRGRWRACSVEWVVRTDRETDSTDVGRGR